MAFHPPSNSGGGTSTCPALASKQLQLSPFSFLTHLQIYFTIGFVFFRHDLFIVLDEIFDLTIYDPLPNEPYQSVLLLIKELEFSYNKVIWLWGLSKVLFIKIYNVCHKT